MITSCKRLFGTLALLLLSLSWGLGSAARAEGGAPSWLDQSHRPFFPKSVGSVVMVQSDFAVLWWSFLFLETAPGKEPAWGEIQAKCQSFAEKSGPLLSRIFCASPLNDPSGTLAEWTRDYPLRHPRPSAQALQEQIKTVLAQASLPIGPLVQILRKDPFQSLLELKTLLESQSAQLRLEPHAGFFWDRATGRVLIPVQFAFAPNDTGKTAQVTQALTEFCAPDGSSCQEPLFIGAHASTLENETQVKADLNRVSIVSFILVFALSAFVLFTRRWRLIFILPPILGAAFLSAIATILVFGRIHGLTLAFGPGIVGLTMDYGLHIAFSNQPGKIWKANLSGLFTTVIVLLVMMVSEIPLLRQLMFFSTVGLLLGFLLVYLIFYLAPHIYTAQPYRIKAPQSAWFSVIVVALIAISLLGAFRGELSLDMRQMNFETPKRAALNRWFYESAGGQGPLLQVTTVGEDDGANALAAAHEQKSWAETQCLRVKNIASFLPGEAEQRANLASWQGGFCAEAPWARELDPTARQFFAPFFKEQTCQAREPQLLRGPVPGYVRDFAANGKWLSVWSPASSAEAEKIKARYPEVISFVDMATFFPKVFARELLWMTPLSLGLAYLILLVYYRSWRLALLAVSPFFSGFGLYLLFALVFSWKTTFISVIGLIMVFGFSLDNGVFATDLMQRQKHRPDDGVWTALTVATVVNIAGFLPLLLCQHPVLQSLGQTLFFGTIGTYMGSVWGIPHLYLMSRLEKA